MAVDPARLPATHRMGEKLARPAGKARYAQRKAIGGAERVDQLPVPDRFRRVQAGGLAKVRGEWDRVLGVEHQAMRVGGHARAGGLPTLAPGRARAQTAVKRPSRRSGVRSGTGPKVGKARCPSRNSIAPPRAARRRQSNASKRGYGRLLLADVGWCAVERRRLLAGANPARQLSLQPVAIGAGDGGNDMA